MAVKYLTRTATIILEPIFCYKCGVCFGMTDDMDNMRQRDKDTFYCPNGHGQVYSGKSFEAELSQAHSALRRAELEKSRLANDNMTLAKKNRSLKQRAVGGMCPCCKRSFVGLARHMKSKHPDFAAKP